MLWTCCCCIGMLCAIVIAIGIGTAQLQIRFAAVPTDFFHRYISSLFSRSVSIAFIPIAPVGQISFAHPPSHPGNDAHALYLGTKHYKQLQVSTLGFCPRVISVSNSPNIVPNILCYLYTYFSACTMVFFRFSLIHQSGRDKGATVVISDNIYSISYTGYHLEFIQVFSTLLWSLCTMVRYP